MRPRVIDLYTDVILNCKKAQCKTVLPLKVLKTKIEYELFLKEEYFKRIGKSTKHNNLQEDRIQLYRAYHPVTFAEMHYPPSYGFQVFGGFFWLISLAFPIFYLIKKYVLNPAPFQLHPDYMVRYVGYVLVN